MTEYDIVSVITIGATEASVVAWTYDLSVPNDATGTELNGYRDIAIATWRTAVEAAGARPGEPRVRLVNVESPEPALDRRTGDLVEGSKRVWRVEGEIL